MDRTKQFEHFAQAERQVCEGMVRVRRQRQLVKELERDGRDASEPRWLLNQFEELLALHIHDRDRLMAELEKIEAA
jgi:hypothetical protein